MLYFSTITIHVGCGANKSQTTVAFIETENRRVMLKLIKHTCLYWFKKRLLHCDQAVLYNCSIFIMYICIDVQYAVFKQYVAIMQTNGVVV